MVAPTNDIIFRFRKVTLNYGGDDVVREVDLEVRRGETKIILGPSGVGKSTILKAMLGLLRPKGGEIYFHGREISKLGERELVKIRLRMAMVFQGSALFDSMTVEENVSFRLREHHMKSEEESAGRVEEVLNFVGLKTALKLRPAQLSGGMKKRVAIARALAPDPEVFLFDEPTTGLDPINTFNVEQLILKLKKRPGTSLVIVTHDVGSASRLADSILLLHEGKFIFEGTAEALRQSSDRRIQMFIDPSKQGVGG